MPCRRCGAPDTEISIPLWVPFALMWLNVEAWIGAIVTGHWLKGVL